MFFINEVYCDHNNHYETQVRRIIKRQQQSRQMCQELAVPSCQILCYDILEFTDKRMNKVDYLRLYFADVDQMNISCFKFLKYILEIKNIF